MRGVALILRGGTRGASRMRSGPAIRSAPHSAPSTPNALQRLAGRPPLPARLTPEDFAEQRERDKQGVARIEGPRQRNAGRGPPRGGHGAPRHLTGSSSHRFAAGAAGAACDVADAAFDAIFAARSASAAPT